MHVILSDLLCLLPLDAKQNGNMIKHNVQRCKRYMAQWTCTISACPYSVTCKHQVKEKVPEGTCG